MSSLGYKIYVLAQDDIREIQADYVVKMSNGMRLWEDRETHLIHAEGTDCFRDLRAAVEAAWMRFHSAKLDLEKREMDFDRRLVEMFGEDEYWKICGALRRDRATIG